MLFSDRWQFSRHVLFSSETRLRYRYSLTDWHHLQPRKGSGLSNESKNSEIIAYVEAIRLALQALVSFDSHELTVAGSVQAHAFRNPSDPHETLKLPIDVDPPGSVEVADYITKLMEYVQIFLVADRLGKKLDISPPLMPPGHDLTPYIKIILTVIGRETGETSPGTERKYYPRPHLQMKDLEVSFVDFAGFLVVLLSDYLRWVADDDDPVSISARLGCDEALRFLIAPETYIEDEDGRVGWGFVPAGCCDEQPMRPLPQHRHVFPTARAIVAIDKYSRTPNPDVALAAQAEDVLPKVTRWLKSLQIEETGMYYPTESDTAHNFPDQIFATEALLTLSRHKQTEAGDLALNALQTLLRQEDQVRILTDLDRSTANRVSIRGVEVDYPSRATRATFLSTLSQGVDASIAAGREESTGAARKLCDQMAQDLLNKRRNPSNLWPQDFLQFHWVRGAVEALLRYSRYVPPQHMSTSKEDLLKAVDALLEEPEFVDCFKKVLLEKVKNRRTKIR